ncbi:MAG: hypothetical protein GY913_34660 [Proteobacteria bacterium]|nr:hypothetical protein [Pseudomonadota bacterium]MCP4922073.1 hypothetical protein [Pseudomonadota bacterium]
MLLALALIGCTKDNEDSGDSGVDCEAVIGFADSDGDGFGDVNDSVEECELPAGYVENSDDCDDADAAVNPDGTEVCNGVDDDCDGGVDLDAGDAATWYADADADGFGDSAVTEVGCEASSGFVEDDTDCDDTDGDTFPGADEYCDGHDDDCDGEVDEDDAVDATTWYADADTDGYGDTAVSVVQCDEPSGHVVDDTDCDDTDADVNPAAVEICNGVDDDCDAGTAEDGMVTWIDGDGLSSDVTSDATGTYTLSSEGDLVFCDGDYTVNLVLEADIDVYSLAGDATSVVLDGDANGSVIAMGDGLSVSVSDLTVTNGSGTYDAEITVSYTGGGIDCLSTSTPTELALSNVVVEGNEAEFGGGLSSQGCWVTLTDGQFADNTANAGGGAWLLDGEHVLSDTTFDGDAANVYGGGFFAYGYSDYAYVELDEVLVDGTSAGSNGGGVHTYFADLVWTGTESTSSGITNAVGGGTSSTGLDEDGALVLVESTFTGTSVDFGTDAGGDDNGPIDVWVNDIAFEYWAGDDATFDCDTSGCGDVDAASMGGSTLSNTLGSRFFFAVIAPTSDATLVSFTPSAVSDGTCTDSQFIVAQAASTTDTDYEVVWVEDVTLSTTGNTTSSDIGIALDTDHAWAVGYTLFCDAGEITFSYDTSTGSSDAGFGTSTELFWSSTDPGEVAVGDTLSGYLDTSFGSSGVEYAIEYTEL